MNRVIARRRCLVRVLAASALSGFGSAQGQAARNPDSTDGSASIAPGEGRRHLRFTLSLNNPTQQTLHDQAVWLYMPAREASHQRLLGLRVSAPHEVTSDALGHTIVKLALAPLPPLATRIVTLSADLAVWPEPRPQPLADPPAWLGAERFIETDSPTVRGRAALLRRDTPRATADAIYDWVRSNMQYAGYVAGDLGARSAAEFLRGDCSEYAYLCAALARVNGIPARTLGGHVVSGNAAPRAEEYHNWAELYLDGAWRVMDAQKEFWGPGVGADHLVFRVYRDRAINPLGTVHRFRVQGQIEARI